MEGMEGYWVWKVICEDGVIASVGLASLCFFCLHIVNVKAKKLARVGILTSEFMVGISFRTFFELHLNLTLVLRMFFLLIFKIVLIYWLFNRSLTPSVHGY